MPKEKIRCSWCLKDDLYKSYHDNEWGTPLHDEQKLFELLCLEGAQAGLSWYTILAKRENYRKAFDNFDAVKMSKYNAAKIEKLLLDAGIVRNRLKVNSFVTMPSFNNSFSIFAALYLLIFTASKLSNAFL